MAQKPSQPIKRVQKVDPRYKSITLESPVLPDDEALSREFAKARPRAKPEYSFVLPTGRVGAKDVQRAVAAAYGPGSSSSSSSSSSFSSFSSSRKTVLPGSAVERLKALPPCNLAGVYSYGGRDYPSFEAAKTANPDMPLISNPPSAEQQYQGRRDRAFLDNIGSGALGLGSIAYVMGGAPDAIQASTQFDEALGGLAAGTARRPGRSTLPTPKAQAPQRGFKEWPGNDGFLYSIRGKLPPNHQFDRFGDEGKLGEASRGGRFTAPFNTPFEQRAVGHRPEDFPYHAYESIVPLPVEQGPAVPWLGQSGGGWQYKHSESMATLLASGRIRRVE